MQMLLPPPVQRALRMLNRAGFEAYAVGGCVRDAVLGRTPNDYDICTSAVPSQMQQVFAGERTLETGLKHGTLTVLMDKMPLEITTFRVDGDYLDGRHPSRVRFTARIGDDLSRRDFTVNAMAYSPINGLIDPFGGQRDCLEGVIRCVGDPRLRFEEDALRILRALRFSAKLGFTVEEKTNRALRELKESLQKISRERIAAECTGLLMGDHAQSVLAAFPDVIFSLFPSLAPMMLCPSDKDGQSVWAHTLRVLSRTPADEALRWAAFLHDSGKPACFREAPAEGSPDDAETSALLAEEILKSLKSSRALTDKTVTLIRWQRETPEKRKIQEMLMHLGSECTDQWLLLQRAHESASEDPKSGNAEKRYALLKAEKDRLIAENACYQIRQLAIGGRELSSLGFQGPGIGEALQALLEKVVRGETENSREALTALAKKLL